MWTECTKDLLDVKVIKLSRQQLKAGKEMTIWKEVCGQKLHFLGKKFKYKVHLSFGWKNVPWLKRNFLNLN